MSDCALDRKGQCFSDFLSAELLLSRKILPKPVIEKKQKQLVYFLKRFFPCTWFSGGKINSVMLHKLFPVGMLTAIYRCLQAKEHISVVFLLFVTGKRSSSGLTVMPVVGIR
jgi:predicted phosphoadenosine phosphosulfate sulfurtransferase